MKHIKKQITILRLMLIRHPINRGKYLKKINIFQKMGDNVWYQPIKIPTQPKLVKIGKDCIIGSGSIVTRDIQDSPIVVGVPAKVIGKTDELIKNIESIVKKKRIVICMMI